VPRLSEADYRSVLDVVREAGDVDGRLPFPHPVLEALRRLVPCDVVTYHERPDSPGPPRLVFVGEPRGPVTHDVREAVGRYRHQDPMTPRDGACKYSDFLTRRKRHRLELYQEADRPVGIEYMMRLWIEPSGAGGARLEFDRGDVDFSERDRAVLDLLLPHLRQLRRRAAKRRRGLTMDGAGRLTPREREILGIVATGATNGEVGSLLGISRQTVRKHLENAYEKLGVHTRTGAVAALLDGRKESL
jgi:DNA-binding CsgD family transcriptional regulator